MKEREGIRARATKSRRPKRTAPKRRTGQKMGRDAGLSAVGMQERLDILTRELREALEQQSATSEVLRVISAAPGELNPVFQAILQKATRICEAKFGTLFLYDGNAFNFAADVVRVIMITAYGDADTKRKALENSAEALFTNPIDFLVLRNGIEMRVERAA